MSRYLLTLVAFLLLQTSIHAQQISHPEYVEVEKNVRLHVTDIGSGRPVVLIHGFPLSDEMYEYQYAALAMRSSEKSLQRQALPFLPLHKAIPNSKLVPFERSGHALFVEERDRFNQQLIEFATN